MALPEREQVPNNLQSLAQKIDSLINAVYEEGKLGRETDSYGKCVEAMWRATDVTFEYVAKRLGVTGFQASIAQLMFLGASRGMESFVVIDHENVLYPQYDLHKQLDEFLENNKEWAQEKARALLAEYDANKRPAAERVVQRWRELAEEDSDGN